MYYDEIASVEDWINHLMPRVIKKIIIVGFIVGFIVGIIIIKLF